MQVVLEDFFEVSPILDAGVYALVKKGVVIYVGQAKQLLSRVYAHRNIAKRAARGLEIPTWLPAKGFIFDQVFIRPCTVQELCALEAAMIEKYKPRYNMSLKSHAPVIAPVNLQIGGAVITINAPKEFTRRV